MKRLVYLLGIGLLFIVISANGALADHNSGDTSPWKRVVEATWQGFKAHYIYCGANCGDNAGLVFDPDIEYQATSEGIGYGLLMAVMMDDQSTFDMIYNAAYIYLFDASTGLFHWRADNSGLITGDGSATDADQDIAAALIFAQRRVERGEWAQHATRPYGVSATALLDAIWSQIVVDGRYLKPGNQFGGNGRDIINLSYFAPAWYRIYDQFQATDRWQGVIEQGYESLFLTQGSPLGLAPDWSNADGGAAFAYCDSIARSREDCLYQMGFDAIRVPWRIGLDCLWFDEPRACDWSRRSAEFLKSLPDGEFARLYDLEGNVMVDYQNEAMVGMWLVAALAAGDQPLQARLERQLSRFAANAVRNQHWGDSPQHYYNQSLAWFAAALLSGNFTNLS